MELHHTDILTDMIVIGAGELRMWSEIKVLAKVYADVVWAAETHGIDIRHE